MNVLCILTDGFEELEAIGTIALLRRAGISIDVFAMDAKKATGRFDITISDLDDLKDAKWNTYDMLFLPGGPHYQRLQESDLVMNIIKAFYENKRDIAAICAAPTILGRAGYLKNKAYTCFTSMNRDFGGNYIDTYVVKDEHLITGRSAAAVIDFAFAIIEQLCGFEKAEEVKASIYYER